jgi:high affinity Mn2+ porin
MTRRWQREAMTLLFSLATMSAGAVAQPAREEAAARESDPWVFHAQLTNVTQGHPPFHAPYSGANSLIPHGRTEETTDFTVYAGAALGPNTELWVNPEVDQGFGLSNTLGLAGFSSGEAYKIGANEPYLRLPRLFLRHVVPLGGDVQPVEGAPNQVAGSRAADNLVLTAGKFSVVDIFDQNVYAHDPRADFLNWSIIDAGAFDYAADSWGFTYGLAGELTRGQWTMRAGFFQLSPKPNGKIIHPDGHKFELVGEAERRLDWSGHPGKARLLVFANRAPMARYDDAVDLARATGDIPDVSLVRHAAWRAGAAINIEQEIASDVGVFARASVNDGSKEAYEFTEINQSFSGGVSLKGQRWGRENDTLGLAVALNALSRSARDYFSAGGLGILIGDGALSYTGERVFESYYSIKLRKWLTFAVDYQHVVNPAHNADRGPVNIWAVRFHMEL